MAAPPIPPLTLVDWLDDLTVRFLLNLPASELSSVPRLCFQVEEAQWYYEDFVRPAVQAAGYPPLPHLPLRSFCLRLFQHCPLLSGFTDAQHLAAYEEFLAYKVRVPVRGAILLDAAMEKLVLVRGWKKGASWSFPRGKINQDERDLACAIREVDEETGFDLAASGLVPSNEEDIKAIDITMREQHMKLFVFRGVPTDTHFEPKTRKEISKIQWYAIKDLPGFQKDKSGGAGGGETAQYAANKFYMVAPFLGPLKKWIHQQRKKDIAEAQRRARQSAGAEQTATEDEVDEVEHETPEQPQGVQIQRREDDLKSLLNLGVPTSPPTASQPAPQANNLLAMLQGSATAASHGRQIPQTPFDQINAFPPQQPATPQPQHLRQPAIGQQFQQGPPPPQFPFSPQSLQYQQQQQQQQRNYPLPAPGIYKPLSPSHTQFPPPGLHSGGMPLQPPPMPPQYTHPTPQFEPRGNMQPPMPFAQLNRGDMPFNGGPPPLRPPPVQAAHLPHPNANIPPILPAHPPSQQLPGAFTAQGPQGPQGPIAAGPAVPNASQLPAPKLKLLDAFKSGKMPAPPSHSVTPAAADAATAKRSARPPSAHQAALLNLINKAPSAAPAASPQETPEVEQLPSVSPPVSDVTEQPRPSRERRPTLNEITRNLGAVPVIKAKAKTPATPTLAPATVTAEPTEERPRSRQLFDPKNPTKFVPPASPIRPGGQQESPPAMRILQRPTSKQGSRSPRLNTGQRPSSPRAANGARNDGTWYASSQQRPSSPRGSNTGRNDGSWYASPQQPPSAPPAPPTYTILPRPVSSRGPKSPVPPSSPLKKESPAGDKWPPTVLKRGEKEEKTKDQLLALFGKTPASPSPSTNAREDEQNTAAAAAPLREAFGNNSNGGGWDHAPQPESSTWTTSSPVQPAAPKFTPTASSIPTSPSIPPPNAQNEQQKTALLGLFNNNNNTTPSPQPSVPSSSSPAPPAAPKLTPTVKPTTSLASAAAGSKQKNLLLELFNKSSSSPVVGGSPTTPISPFALGTPASSLPPPSKLSDGARNSAAAPGTEKEREKKEFLMGYLNGVVRNG